MIGAALWAVGVSLLGFFLGKQIGEDNIDHYLLPIVSLIIRVVVDPAVPRMAQAQARKRRRRSRDAGVH